jgi:hypothetical protein
VATSFAAFDGYARVLRNVAEVVPGYRIVPLGEPGTGFLILSRFGLTSLDRVLVPRLSDDDVIAAVSGVEDEARAAGATVNWWVDPEARPASLAQSLVDRGYEGSRTFPVMSRDLQDLPALDPPPGVELRWARGAEPIRESQIVAGTAFGRPAAAVQSMADALSTPVVVGYPSAAFATAHIDDRMIGSGTLWIADGVAGILNVGTLDVARGRGVGYAVTLALLLRAREVGADHAALHASPAGFRIYLRMGFRHDGDVRVYRGPADLG